MMPRKDPLTKAVKDVEFALGVFTTAADSLDDAAHRLVIVAAEADEAAAAAALRAGTARAQALGATTKASRIRELLG